MSWKRRVTYLVVSILGGLIFGFLAGMLCTPLLWRLEQVLGIELAGHSGPSDWVMYLFFVVMAALIETLLLYFDRSRRAGTKP